MTAIAKLKFQRGSAQKVRLVADQVRGKTAEAALDVLLYSNKRAATLVQKTLESAIANAEHNFGLDIDELRVSEIFVDEGPQLKRWRARAKGRAARIIKQTCHITVIVSE